MSPIISAIITKALDGLHLRSMATAQNIANANSPGYRSLSVSFEDELAAAAARGDEQSVRSIHLGMDEVGIAEGVRLDLEMANQSATARRYGALIDVLGRDLQLQRSAIRGGQ